MKQVKQVIIIRKDLKMRRGKEIAQGSHASMSFITRRLKRCDSGMFQLKLSNTEQEWLNSSFRKITLQVNSEEELLNVFNEAKNKGLETHLITDNGITEFNGIPTHTCLAIGPDLDEKIDEVTRNLKLY